MKLAVVLLSLVLGLLTSVFAATNTFNGNLDLGPEGTLIGDANDLWRVSGDLNSQTTNAAYNILASTFEFTGTGAHNLEQFSRDLGPCAGNISNNFAFGTLKTAGTVTIVDNFPNSAGADAVYVQAITGSGTLNVGAGMKLYFGVTNGFSGVVNVTGDGVFRAYLPDALDSDGDGVVNSNECACGTDPTNANSVLRITSITREAGDIRVTWTAAGGHNYVLQTNALLVGGSFANNFSDLIGPFAVPDTGESTTNYLDVGGATNQPARYYRIRLVP